jgi:hypothetical protein
MPRFRPYPSSWLYTLILAILASTLLASTIHSAAQPGVTVDHGDRPGWGTDRVRRKAKNLTGITADSVTARPADSDEKASSPVSPP